VEIREIEHKIACGEMTAAQVFTQMLQHVRAYQEDAKRYHYLRDNQTWHRYGTLSDPDSYAFVGCKFPYLANFTAKPMLDHNIDKMMEGESA
jgi:hypothetical protein